MWSIVGSDYGDGILYRDEEQLGEVDFEWEIQEDPNGRQKVEGTITSADGSLVLTPLDSVILRYHKKNTQRLRIETDLGSGQYGVSGYVTDRK